MDVISKDFNFAKPVLFNVAQGTLNSVVGQLTGDGNKLAFNSPVPGGIEHATQLVFKRAVVAEAALQTLATLTREKLDLPHIKPSPNRGGEEGFLDMNKSGIQKIGPAVLDTANKAVRAVAPVIVDDASKKIKGAVGASSSTTPLPITTAATATR